MYWSSPSRWRDLSFFGVVYSWFLYHFVGCISTDVEAFSADIIYRSEDDYILGTRLYSTSLSTRRQVSHLIMAAVRLPSLARALQAHRKW